MLANKFQSNFLQISTSALRDIAEVVASTRQALINAPVLLDSGPKELVVWVC